MNIARYEKRVAAYLIDMALSFLPALAGGIALLHYYPEVIPWFFVILIVALATWILYTLYCTLALWIFNGETIGNALTGIRVIHQNLERIGFLDAFLRSANLGVLVLAIVNAAYMLSVHTERTIFDRLSGTVSVEWRRRNL